MNDNSPINRQLVPIKSFILYPWTFCKITLKSETYLRKLIVINHHLPSSSRNADPFSNSKEYTMLVTCFKLINLWVREPFFMASARHTRRPCIFAALFGPFIVDLPVGIIRTSFVNSVIWSLFLLVLPGPTILGDWIWVTICWTERGVRTGRRGWAFMRLSVTAIILFQ